MESALLLGRSFCFATEIGRRTREWDRLNVGDGCRRPRTRGADRSEQWVRLRVEEMSPMAKRQKAAGDVPVLAGTDGPPLREALAVEAPRAEAAAAPAQGKPSAEPTLEVTQIEPEEAELEHIAEVTRSKANYFVAWEASVWGADGPRSHFETNEKIFINIRCAASKLLVQLKPSYRIEIITFDARTLQPQKGYSMVIDQQVRYAHFRVSHRMDAHLRGLFKFQLIVIVRDTDLFQVFDGDYFEVV